MSVVKTSLTYLRYKFKCSLLPTKRVAMVLRRQIHDMSASDAGIVSVTDIKRQLRQNGLSLEDGFACLITKCPICKHTEKSEAKNTYINKTTGFFQCPHCDCSGQWSAIQSILNAKKIDFGSKDLPAGIVRSEHNFHKCWEKNADNSTALGELADERVQEILRHFDLPSFADASKVLSTSRVSSDGQKLHFPLVDSIGRVVGRLTRFWTDQRGHGTTKSGSPASDNGFSGAFKDDVVFSEDGAVSREACSGILLLRSSRTSNKEPPVIVSNVADALAVVANKISGGAICLPYGFASLPLQLLPSLERYSKLVLWAGAEHASHAARKLTHHRCLLIRPTEAHPSALEAHKAGLDLKSIVSSAKPVWHKAITTFASLREDVLSDLHNIDKIKGIKWRRYPSLSRLLQGHRRGELTVLTGPTGCGKTTFCSEYSLDLAMQGVNTLWGSFEIRNSRLARTMLQQLAGFPLEERLQEFDRVADDFQRLPIYFLMFHGQQSLKDVMEAVEHATYVHDIAHVIIDNVQFMLGVGSEAARHGERFWKQDSVVAAFRHFATNHNCHVTLVMHPRKERDAEDLSTSSIFGSAKASQEADNVLIIQDKRLTALKGKKLLQVAKNRYSGDLGVVPLIFDKSSLSYAPRKRPAASSDSSPQESDTL